MVLVMMGCLNVTDPKSVRRVAIALVGSCELREAAEPTQEVLILGEGTGIGGCERGLSGSNELLEGVGISNGPWNRG